MEEAEVMSQAKVLSWKGWRQVEVGDWGLHTEDGAKCLWESEVKLGRQAESSSGDTVAFQHGTWPRPCR